MPITGLYQPIDSDEAEVGSIVSNDAIFAKLAENLNYFIDSNQVGSVIWTLEGITGMPTPNPKIWQACDGSMITEPNSPLLGQLTPPLANVGGPGTGPYIKAVNTGIGLFGGSNSMSLQHNHGGTVGPIGSGLDQADQDDDLPIAAAHTHTIPSDLTTYNVEPVHIHLKAYIKIL